MNEEKTIRISQYEYKNLLSKQHVLHCLQTALVAYTLVSTYGKEAYIDSAFFKTLRVIDPATAELIDERVTEVLEAKENEEG